MRVGAQGRRSSSVVALVLVLAMPILVTMARRSCYLPTPDHGQYLLNANKAKLAHGSNLNDDSPVRAVIAPMRSEHLLHEEMYFEPASSRSSYSPNPTVSLQLRSPPVSFA